MLPEVLTASLKNVNQLIHVKFWGFNSGEYEDYGIPHCDIMRFVDTYQRFVKPCSLDLHGTINITKLIGLTYNQHMKSTINPLVI